jgi:hypothetical protein
MATNANLRRKGSGQPDYYGFASVSDEYTWQMHGRKLTAGGNDAESEGEIFADQFLGWVFGQWDPHNTPAARDRATWMNSTMPYWIIQMANLSANNESTILDYVYVRH